VFFLIVFLAYVSADNWFPAFKSFLNIWPLRLWITSLGGLIFLYWITGYCYNKWLSDLGGWIDSTKRMGLILADLVINLGLGIYYMQHRDTLMGAFMLQCPIAISPLIFILELICVYFYHRYYKYKKKPPTNPVEIKKTTTNSSPLSPRIVQKTFEETKNLSTTVLKENNLSKEEDFWDKHKLSKEESMLYYLIELEKWKNNWPWARGKPPVRPK